MGEYEDLKGIRVVKPREYFIHALPTSQVKDFKPPLGCRVTKVENFGDESLVSFVCVLTSLTLPNLVL